MNVAKLERFVAHLKFNPPDPFVALPHIEIPRLAALLGDFGYLDPATSAPLGLGMGFPDGKPASEGRAREDQGERVKGPV